MLEHVKCQFGALSGENKTIANGMSTVNLPSKVDGLKGGSEVWNDTGHTEVQSLLGDFSKAEGILDNFLERHENRALVHCTKQR